MNDDLMAHVALNNYFYLQKLLREINDEEKYCPLCAEQECDHNVDKVDGIETKERVSWWQEICFIQARNINLTTEGFFPIWPEININLDTISQINYTLYPRLENKHLTGIYKSNNECLIYLNGKELVKGSFDIPDGTYWGYIIDGKFTCIRKFSDGKWSYTKTFPNILHLGLETKTYWAIPSGKITHWEFYNYMRIK